MTKKINVQDYSMQVERQHRLDECVVEILSKSGLRAIYSYLGNLIPSSSCEPERVDYIKRNIVQIIDNVAYRLVDHHDKVPNGALGVQLKEESRDLYSNSKGMDDLAQELESLATILCNNSSGPSRKKRQFATNFWFGCAS
ncbi:hypothetical protein COU54_02390 [Candidatus Pacearchaeota archaeon CG10_big_fil_rev_8_21_14_0_10_31_24]|nr:MAG: hypothetical protein COU54_02390 [Candidatus Pacearchaeota archaeon CG10_big_fil_rev_8_21_14_0_10_31_24]